MGTKGSSSISVSLDISLNCVLMVLSNSNLISISLFPCFLAGNVVIQVLVDNFFINFFSLLDYSLDCGLFSSFKLFLGWQLRFSVKLSSFLVSKVSDDLLVDIFPLVGSSDVLRSLIWPLLSEGSSGGLDHWSTLNFSIDGYFNGMIDWAVLLVLDQNSLDIRIS